MTPMAPTRPIRPPNPITIAAATGLSAANGTGVRVSRVVRLASRLSAVAAARAEVEAAIRAWCVAVDPDVAILLTSELVTNAVTHGTLTTGTFVILTVGCDAAGLRVDVHDGSSDLPVVDAASAEAETGRGLLLVTSLSAEWGFYRTSAGKAVYFTLDFTRDSSETAPD